ncbi:MAG: 2-amino-4-hydroxy-6-hydroxymethyldihydropteridine diphosphokinase [Pirellulaceae bacterium]|nr:2-amino-4-hydroxy-6-hydroxymethyldihydropteridine diphosphokinase [Pirellulaceae bacterium]
MSSNAESANESRAKSQCLISFGSNLGDRADLIAEAAGRIAISPLASGYGGLRTSRLFETPPIGGPGGQDPFLNAIGAFGTDATARDVLALLQDLENELGRQRRRRWDARSIDLDVVLHGELVGGGTGLIVPHPRYTARQFVLQPACDVAPHYRDPRFGWTLERLAKHLSAGVPSLALTGGDFQTRQRLIQRLSAEHGITTFAAKQISEPMDVVGNAPAPSPLPVHESTPARLGLDQAGAAENEAKYNKPRTDEPQNFDGEPIAVTGVTPWVAAYIPPLPPLESEATDAATVPRLVARLQRTTPQTRWPAPHQMWPTGWRWPEYRLEVDDLDWAVKEILSALESMRCPLAAVTNDGQWWR